ncbi:MAG: gamma-glutamyl-gamma-aminobutyrate hydrolase family protein [Peptococcaceae bacterium]|nr:gamma-glutamyl-gamma-aminobutyrate hydrolase family protein [Peptococcaceae bacterium]
MAPLIGITTAHYEEEINTYPRQFYAQAVLKAGGIPMLLPIADKHVVDSYLAVLDGLILSGGSDVDPYCFKQEPLPGTGKVYPERDAWEIALAERALASGMPVLGICRGIQVMNIACGGTIYQDIANFQGGLGHDQKAPRSQAWHSVKVSQGSRLADICGTEHLRVNSFHHQALELVAERFCVVGQASDGIIEAIEAKHEEFALGVQWHPETMVDTDYRSLALFQALVKACASKA